MDHRLNGRRDAGPVAVRQPFFDPQVSFFPAGTFSSATPDPEPYPLVDVSPLHAEICRLRQLLGQANINAEQQAQTIRRAVEQHAAQASARHRAEASRHQAESAKAMEQLQHQLRTLRQESETRTSALRQRLTEADDQLSKARETAQSDSQQIRSLKEELAHLAAAAAEEQQQLRQHSAAQARRYEAARQADSAEAKSLHAAFISAEAQIVQWRCVHELATDLCDDYESQVRRQRVVLNRLRCEYDRYRIATSEAFSAYETEIGQLKAEIAVLYTDHEAVELTNAELDHYAARLESDLDRLQADSQQSLVAVTEDHQESARIITELNAQLHTTKTRLMTVSEENRSLVESLGKLKSAAEDYDATLFAKDQKIDATNRLAVKAQHQLEQMRREYNVAAGQIEDLRVKKRTLSKAQSELESKLNQAIERATHAEQTAERQEQNLREFQTAARAAEADSQLRASEAEQQYAVEIQRLEAELEDRKSGDQRDVRIETEYQAKIAELESALQEGRNSWNASASEIDRLQATIEQLNQRLSAAQNTAEQSEKWIEQLQAASSDLKDELGVLADENAQLRHESEQQRQQLADYADRVATQQQEIARHELESGRLQQEPQNSHSDPDVAILKERIAELENNQLTLRERHHQSQITNERLIETLNQEVNGLIAQRDVLTGQLQDRSQFENPINEVNRLTRELARKTSEHAREREALLARIETLGESAARNRAA